MNKLACLVIKNTYVQKTQRRTLRLSISAPNYSPPAAQMLVALDTCAAYLSGYAETCTFWHSVPTAMDCQPLIFFILAKNCAADLAGSMSAAMSV